MIAMKQHPFSLSAKSPAGLAEEFLVKSIWFNHYPAGTFLPGERELAEKIGVTRSTLREVTQRLARDGWLTIQHGKPTLVNDIWQTGGPNIIHTLLKLDESLRPVIVENVVSLRTQMGERYIPTAIRTNPTKCLSIFDALDQLVKQPRSEYSMKKNAKLFAKFDYALYREFAFLANKPIYGLILNSFKPLYIQLATLFFSYSETQLAAISFYQQLQKCVENSDATLATQLLEENQRHSRKIWQEMLQRLPKNILV